MPTSPTLHFAAVHRDRIKDWLRYLEKPKVNFKQFARYEDELVSTLNKGLNNPQEFHDSLQLLMRVLPYFMMNLGHVEKWSPLLMEALLPAMDLRAPELQTQVFRWLGETSLKKSKHKSARESFTTALERANDGRRDDMMLAAYIGLIKLQWFDIKNSVATDAVKEILAIAQRVEDKPLRANLHYALAHAYLRIGETQVALGHAQMNYLYWIQLEDETEVGAAALTLATVYRNVTLYHDAPVGLVHAKYFLNLAWTKMSSSDYVWRNPLLSYEAGIMFMQQGDFAKAEESLSHALAKARESNTPQHIVIAHHALGLNETYLEQWEESRENLFTALRMWRSFDNHYEMANTLQGLGYLEYRSGHPEQALAYLNDALAMTSELQDVLQRDRLQNLIRQTINTVSSDSTSARG